jgi:K+-transporting ATPase KdpF subunit
MMTPTILVITTRAFEMNNPAGYAIGAVIAVVILAYLIYSLIKPENF